MPRPIMTGDRDAHDYLRRRYYAYHQPYGVTGVPMTKAQAHSAAFADFIARKRALQQWRR